jgi:putative transposase
MSGKYALLHENRYYHVYNGAVGNEKLFVSIDNYHYFLDRIHSYLEPVSNLFCYSLLPNQFHLFLQIKNAEAVVKQMQTLKYRCNFEHCYIPQFLLEQFSNFFNSYAKAYNKFHHRSGRLFLEPFRRMRISDPADFAQLVKSIHARPLHFRLCKNMDHWPYSSYQPLIKNEMGWLCPEEVMKWFGSVDGFKVAHELPAKVLAW